MHSFKCICGRCRKSICSSQKCLLPWKQRQHLETITFLREQHLDVWIGICITSIMSHFCGLQIGNPRREKHGIAPSSYTRVLCNEILPRYLNCKAAIVVNKMDTSRSIENIFSAEGLVVVITGGGSGSSLISEYHPLARN